MPTTNAELAELLNSQLALTGPEAVTANVIRQWVAWDVLPKANAHGRSIGSGPSWSRSDVAIRRALRLAELRMLGLRRESALIVQAYIEWGHPDFDRVRDAVLKEWAKWASQITRRQTTSLGKDDYRWISSTKKRAIANQLGELDHRFTGTIFEQSPEFYAVFNEISKAGEFDLAKIVELSEPAFEKIDLKLASLPIQDALIALLPIFSGLLGNPDEIENSADSLIRSASERQFRIARHEVRRFLKFAQNPDLQSLVSAISPSMGEMWKMMNSLLPQISIGPWLQFGFLMALKFTSESHKN